MFCKFQVLFANYFWYRHKEVESLNHNFKDQVKERQDVIVDLTRQNEEKMKRQIDLEQQIAAWEKKNEKTKTETVKNY